MWAVRFSLANSDQGIAFTLGDAPCFYAPKPVANCLYSGSTTLTTYTIGSGLGAGTGSDTATFTSVDLNRWMAQALLAIDTFLSPTYAGRRSF